MLPSPLYQTDQGQMFFADSLDILRRLPENYLDLVMTSPPFALVTKKAYGNKNQDDYCDWLCQFGQEVLRVLKPTGSFVIDLGGCYQKGLPIKSLYQYRVLIQLCDTIGFNLAQEFYWYNPSKLPSPIEWVNIRKIRVKDSVNNIWWLSKTPNPKVNVKNVLVPYSDSMQKQLNSQLKTQQRPSGHRIVSKIFKDNGGAIPSNLLQIANTESNSQYHKLCKQLQVKAHPARFPKALPEFFIKMLTDPQDLVCDIFAGSNTTGAVSQRLDRRWLSVEFNKEYAIHSVLRFLSDKSPEDLVKAIDYLQQGGDLLKV